MNKVDELSPQFFFTLEGYFHADLFRPITYVWEALSLLIPYLEQQTLGKIEIEVPPSVYLVHPSLISIGQGTRIEPGVYIQGPCIIGENCTLRHGAYIRGNVIIGKECVVGAEVKHSILLDGVHIAHRNYVGDSILGNGTRLGAGANLSNLRFDGKEILIVFNGKKYPTQLRKLGAIIGDKSQIGCNVVTNPGTLLGRNVFCHPCINVRGVFLQETVIKD